MNRSTPHPRPTLPATTPADLTQSLLRMAVGSESMAVPIDDVREILEVGRLTALPRTPAFVRGVMNLRGAVVPVIDLAARVGQPHVDAGCTGHTVAGDLVRLQHLQHRALQPVDIFLDVDAQAPQVDQRVGHHLARAVVGDLTTAVGGHHRDATSVQQVLRLAGQALGVDRVVLNQPNFVRRGLGARLGEGAHRVHRLGIGLAAQRFDQHADNDNPPTPRAPPASGRRGSGAAGSPSRPASGRPWTAPKALRGGVTAPP